MSAYWSCSARVAVAMTVRAAGRGHCGEDGQALARARPGPHRQPPVGPEDTCHQAGHLPLAGAGLAAAGQRGDEVVEEGLGPGRGVGGSRHRPNLAMLADPFADRLAGRGPLIG